MRTRALLIGLMIIGVILISAIGVQAKSAQGGAFLTEYAGSVDQVIQQIEANRLVALRYAKQFHMDPASVLVYFRSELSLATLDNSATMLVYSIGDSSQIVSENMEFKKGAKVFVDSHGVPILELGTGNPLGTSIKPGNITDEIKNESNPKPADNGQHSLLQATNQPGTEVPGATDGTQAPLIPTNAATEPLSPPTVSPTVAVTTPTAGDVGPVVPQVGGHHTTNWMLPLGLAGAVAALAGGGGGGSSAPPADGGRTDGGGNPPPVVPEPIGLISMATGMAAFAGLIARRRGRK